MKRILLLFSALMLSCIALWAHDVVIGGIYYYLDETSKTAIVTYRGDDYDDYDDEYSGSVTIPETITYNSEIYSVTSISGAFYNCSELTSVTIPNSVTSISGVAFSGCSSLTSITIPNSVTSIGYHTFSGCSSLTSITIPNSVTSIGDGAFEDCSGLTSVSIGESVTSIDQYAFYGCSGLTSVTIPNSVTSIGFCAFDNCSELTEVTIPNSVTSIGQNAFSGTGIYNNKSNWDNGILYIDNCLIKAKSDIVKGFYTIKKGTRIIGGQAFDNCSGLTEVIIPNSVTSIGDGAFQYCSELTEVSIPNSVTSIGDGAFYNCSRLTWVTIPNSVTSIGQHAFDNCSELTEVSIPNSVTSIGSYAFSRCSGLTKVNYLGTVDKWVEIDFEIYESNPTYYAKDLYINNELLTDVKITTADSIKDCAFYNCQSIKSVDIGESVTSIGYYAFYGCSGLTSVTIPNSVTSIDQYAFKDCSGITEVSIGESVTSIGEDAFSGCDKLRKVTAYPTTVPNVYESSFAHYNAALYVPCDVYDDYFFDDVFGTFKVTECIAAEEVDAPEKVEIEVDEENNANVIWPSTDGAKKYELEISKDSEVFCTLLFNENGQLTSIDFGNRSASVGFQFTVTGLDGASKYAYSMVAMDKKGNELQSYKGTFTTNGYVPGPGEEDEPVSITETLADANITVSDGTISAEADFSIYNTIGQNVTAQNGSLQPGVYLVSIENDIVKVMIK